MTARMPLARNETGDRFEVGDGEYARFDATERVWYGDAGGPGGSITPLSLTYYADVDRAEAAPDGSIALPFPVLQDLIDAGAVVGLVVPGAYAETIVPSATLALIGLPSNSDIAPAVIDGINFQGNGDALYLEGLSVGNVTVSGAIAVELKCERVAFSTIEADGGGGITVYAQRCTFGGIDAGSGTLNFQECNAQNGITEATEILASDSTIGDVFALEATFRDCLWTTESDLTQAGASGGGAPHANPPWRFIGCTFEVPVNLVSQGGGESFAVYMDRESWDSFWAAGGTTTGVTIYRDGSIQGFSIFASDGTNTVDSSTGTTYLPVTAGGSGFGVSAGSSPFTGPTAPTDQGVVTYNLDYVGAGSPPPTPPAIGLVRIVASVRTVLGGNVGLAVSVDGDVLGEALTQRLNNNQVTRAPANTTVQITTERIVNFTLGGEVTVQPAFASDSNDDLTIESCTLSIVPLSPVAGY